MRGRKPTPTAIKDLRGTTRQDRANPSEPQFDVPARTPSPPDWLDEPAAEVWRDLGRMLLNAGLYTVVDKYALAMFCAAAGRWIGAERRLQEEGPILYSAESGNPYQNPWLHVANKGWDQMNKMLGEFGLTPAERSRVKALVQDEEPSLADVLFQSIEVKS
jgi:P27 family predicted phage terminase small subunit